MVQVFIKENAWIAKIAAYRLRVPACAIVFRSTIYLCGIHRHHFLENSAWVRHEVCHVQQWKRDGIFLFFFQYIWYSLRYGYRNNPYEIEAREAEKNTTLCQDVEIIE